MKKICIFVLCFFILLLSSCTDPNKNENGEVNDYKPVITDEDIIKGYYNAIKSTDNKDIVNVTINDITINERYPTFNKYLEIVDITNSYNIIPYNVYYETIDKLFFQYGASFNFYGYYNNEIHTIKWLYENKLIDMEFVCELFSIMSRSNKKLSSNEYEDIASKVSFGLIDRYFGSFDGYSAFTLAFTSNLCVTEPIRVYDVMFEFPYPDTHIRFVKDDEMISLSPLNLCVSRDSIYELFSMYTRSDKVSKKLINMLLEPVEKVYLEYVSDFTIDDLYLQFYYGSIDDVHLYSFGSNVWLAGIVDKNTTGFVSSLLYGGGWTTVYYQGNVYLLDEAINLGLITKDQANKIIWG